MIQCHACGYEGEYTGRHCPHCGGELTLSVEEMAELHAALRLAVAHREYETVFAYRHILADMGDTEAQRDYASMLERGEMGERDPDGAMVYYAMAAEKNDPYAAYRYARLLSRTSDIAGRFWLRYAAVLGCEEAYSAVAADYAATEDETTAQYYYRLAAEGGEADAIVTLARRYYEGIGTPVCEAHAKWFLDKLVLPPIGAIKLAYRLRGVVAEEPPAQPLEGYDRLLRTLAAQAREYQFHTAYHYLVSLLCERGSLQAEMTLGTLYAEGIGCQQDVSRAIPLLEAALAHGHAGAGVYLGEMYVAGRLVAADTERALSYYRQAAKLGYTNAYETMGDLYAEGRICRRDLARAIELYDLAAIGGDDSARQKAERLKKRREDVLAEGYRKVNTAPEQAFRAFATAVTMGHPEAKLPLGRCLQYGVGTRIDRAAAYAFYEAAAHADGDDRALLPLGLCYAEGIGTRFDYRLALTTLRRAAALTDDEQVREQAREVANRLQARRLRKLTRAVYATAMELIHQRKFAEAVRMLEVGEPLAYPKALYTLGCLYEFGRGVPVDKARAFALYEQAYRGNGTEVFRDPRARYKLFVLNMVR